ncbi:MAG TPA: LysM peptidoglycan-binding domain-containing protein [Candidatus Onthousia excrementipullorum]|uniref:LysM peptidoglycan-binding domain-containing protein n=1 Tax=Candidatus Onthousia excrementipullorum TaxID=2840884 RepID=A0A9D1J2H4_9FIRM|nr:LysM peptidoglycan-binding domain-containing protein [Candidatus Onthousia excrementipullorum]
MNFNIIFNIWDFLLPSHGGADPGAVSGGLQEKDFTLEASLYMADRLKELGIPVVLTRDYDENISRTERLRRANEAFGGSPNAILISNHINAGGGEGAEVIYALRNNSTLAQSILEEIGSEGQIMRKYYQRRLPEDPSKDYYYIIRETTPMQSVLVEYGFIDNANDRVKLQNDLLNYVEAVVRAIAEYAGVPYTPPEGSGNNFYTVVKGDSLWSIANRFGVTVQALRDANNLTSDVLSVGQILRIPGSNEGDEIVPPSGNVTYTVQRGDSLWSIASRYGISVNDLRRANNLTSDTLSIGQVLIIPGVGSGNEGNDNITGPSTTYTVVSGDSLWSIANRFGVTVQALRDANNLTSDVLSVGQVLTIPGVSGEEDNGEDEDNGAVFYYTVERGDSLWSIARRFGVTVQEIRDANDLTSDTLSVGQSLIIPGISAGDDLEDNEENDTVPTTYTVVSGDSLWSIANRFGVTVSDLKSANGLTSNLLSVGQVLIIPTAGSSTPGSPIYNTYIVASGDSLWSIANRFGTTVDTIKTLNNLTSNLLSIGQVLQIPNN